MALFPYEIQYIALLLVEDEPNARDMLKAMLARNYPGLRVYAAENGADGLDLFREHHPEIVVTDISMPVMNGIQMTREIRRSYRRRPSSP
jgi:YesN/AraC family two-component response regulator